MKLPIPKAALAQHVIALGKTGAGKSSKMRLIIEDALNGATPVCIVDVKGDWWGLKSSADGKKSGYPIIIFGSEYARHADVRINATSGAEIGQLVASGNRSALIDLKGMSVGDRNKFFVGFAEAYFRHAAGQRILMIDEVHNFAPQGKILSFEATQSLHWANRLITEGRGMGITMFSASQRPQKVHKDFVTSNETLIACRVIHKLDRDAIKDWIDACGDKDVGMEVLSNLANMQRTDAWVYSPEAEFGPKKITFPMFATYDSFAPQGVSKAKLKGWADVDLGEVQAQIAKTVEEHKANDPKELKAEIVRLTAELKRATGSIKQVDTSKIEAQGYRLGFEEASKIALSIHRDLRDQALMSVHEFATDFKSKYSKLVMALPQLAPIPSGSPTPPGKFGVDAQKRAQAAIPVARKPSPVGSGDGTLSPTARKIVDAIHRAHPMALSFEAAAARAGVSRRSSAYNSYRKEVQACVEVNPRDDGKFQSSPGYAAAVSSGADPVEEFANRLPPSFAGMLRAIAAQGLLTREQVAQAANISPTSSGLSGGLRELMALSLIEKQGDFYQLHSDLR